MQKITKVTFFGHNMSKTKNLTHASLGQNVLYTLFFIVCFTSYLEKSTKNKSESVHYRQNI